MANVGDSSSSDSSVAVFWESRMPKVFASSNRTGSLGLGKALEVAGLYVQRGERPDDRNFLKARVGGNQAWTLPANTNFAVLFGNVRATSGASAKRTRDSASGDVFANALTSIFEKRMQVVAMGLPSVDASGTIFDYMNGNDLPGSYQEVLDIAAQLKDVPKHLVVAWFATASTKSLPFVVTALESAISGGFNSDEAYNIMSDHLVAQNIPLIRFDYLVQNLIEDVSPDRVMTAYELASQVAQKSQFNSWASSLEEDYGDFLVQRADAADVDVIEGRTFRGLAIKHYERSIALSPDNGRSQSIREKVAYQGASVRDIPVTFTSMGEVQYPNQVVVRDREGVVRPFDARATGFAGFIDLDTGMDEFFSDEEFRAIMDFEVAHPTVWRLIKDDPRMWKIVQKALEASRIAESGDIHSEMFKYALITSCLEAHILYHDPDKLFSADNLIVIGGASTFGVSNALGITRVPTVGVTAAGASPIAR
jgi:hypothetical protein